MCVHKVHTMEQQAVLKSAARSGWEIMGKRWEEGVCEVYAFHLLSPKSQTPSTLQEVNLSEKLRIKAKKVHCSCRGPEFGS